MPSELTWFDDSKTIAYERIYGKWSIQEALDNVIASGNTMLDEHTPMPVYFIIDVLEAEGVPSGILSKQPRIAEITTKESFSVIVGAHDVIRFFVESMQRLGLNRDIVFVKTIDDAIACIEQHRQEQAESA